MGDKTPNAEAIEAADQQYVMRPWTHPAGEPVIVAKAKNCVVTDANHDDGIQGFKPGGGTISGLVIDRNTILEWTAAPDHPLRCALQGMFLSDAIYENLVVSNNLVSTSQYHGITLSGGRNAKIVNNTVVNAKGVTGSTP